MSDRPRGHVHDTTIGIRINKRLLASVEEKARRKEMSLSELIRAALRRELREIA